jgi:hypothetical protein
MTENQPMWSPRNARRFRMSQRDRPVAIGAEWSVMPLLGRHGGGSAAAQLRVCVVGRRETAIFSPEDLSAS